MTPRMSLRRGCLVPLLVILALVLAGSAYIWRDRHTWQDALSYSTRPLWDRPADPKVLLPHYTADGLASNDDAACRRHGWETYPGTRRLIDATLFSTEIELLEVRLRELWDVVDVFVIVESTHDLMGQKKNLTFSENKNLFAPWLPKIAHHIYTGREMANSDGAFTLVNEMRRGVEHFIRETVKPDPTSLILMSDVDEIPSLGTMQLLKHCRSPLPIHLQMQNYIYSFEFPTDMHSWRAQLHQADDGKSYMHGKTADVALVDAGWHCSFCFRNLWEFAFKMQGASHADRLYNRLNWRKYLDPARIQDKICKGEDLFDMLPEAYTWHELIRLWRGATRSVSAAHLPKAVVQDTQRFRWLLPGGCQRQ